MPESAFQLYMCGIFFHPPSAGIERGGKSIDSIVVWACVCQLQLGMDVMTHAKPQKSMEIFSGISVPFQHGTELPVHVN